MNRDIFNKIAPGWYNFRHRSIFIRELEWLAQRWKKGKLLNVGCGHGADFLPFKNDFELYGLDFSAEMLKFAQKYAHKFVFPVELSLGDARFLPFRDETFEWAIAVATYHHLHSEEQRLQALRELRRVLKPGGEAFITVWNHWQPRFWLSRRNVLVPWRTKRGVLYRYYYLFSYHELKRLVKQANFDILETFPESSYRFPIKFFSRNICLLVQRTK